MTDRGRERSPLAGAGLVIAAAALAITIAGVAPPELPVLRFEPGPTMVDPPPGATLYLQIEP